MVHIPSQSTAIPQRIGNTENPDRAILLANGWRDMGPVPPLAEGYTRLALRWVDAGDGVNADVVVDDRLTADIEADRQAAKPVALKAIENQFLAICEQLSGSRAKMGFAELQECIESLMATNQNAAVVLSLRLLTIDAAGKREGGLAWWDDIAWHPEVSQ